MPAACSWSELLQATDGLAKSFLQGTGSFGRVYRHRLPDGTSVAIKVLATSDRAQQEQQVLSQMRRPTSSTS